MNVPAVSSSSSSVAWVCLSLGIGGTEWELLVALIFDVWLGQTFVEEFVGVFGDYHLCTYEHFVHQQYLTPF